MIYVCNEASHGMSRSPLKNACIRITDEVSQEVDVGVGVEQGDGDSIPVAGVGHRSLGPMKRKVST